MNERIDKLVEFSMLAALVVGLAATPSNAQTQEIGAEKPIGVGLGWGTFAAGITGKYYLGGGSALQGHLGSAFGVSDPGRFDEDRVADDGLGISIDYVFEPNFLLEEPAGRLFWGFGAGGAVFGDDTTSGVAVNGVLELGWHFADVPIELVIDYRPFIAFGTDYTDVEFFLPTGFSARFFF